MYHSSDYLVPWGHGIAYQTQPHYLTIGYNRLLVQSKYDAISCVCSQKKDCVTGARRQ